MLLSHKTKIYPNKTNIKWLDQVFGFRRFCFNYGLAIWKEMYREGLKPNKRKVRDEFRYHIDNKEELKWIKDMPNVIFENAIEDLGNGYNLFFAYLKAKKRGEKRPKARPPKFKKKKKAKLTCAIHRKNDTAIRIKNDKLFIPKVPYGIKLAEQPRYEGTIKLVTIKKEHGSYYVSFTIDTEFYDEKNKKNNKAIGIDLGVKKLMTYSIERKNNKKVVTTLPKDKLIALEKKIKKKQRQLSKKDYNSNRYNKAKIKLQRLYYKVKCIKMDIINKATTHITRNYKYIGIEDLKVSNIMKNRHLSKSIHESCFYTIKVMLIAKSIMRGKNITVANIFYPSTQTCSSYKTILKGKDKLSLNDRIYKCDKCGMVKDRDVNAAINLKDYALGKVS